MDVFSSKCRVVLCDSWFWVYLDAKGNYSFLGRHSVRGFRICRPIHHYYLLTRRATVILCRGLLWRALAASFYVVFWFFCPVPGLLGGAGGVFCTVVDLWVVDVCCSFGDLGPLRSIRCIGLAVPGLTPRQPLKDYFSSFYDFSVNLSRDYETLWALCDFDNYIRKYHRS